MSEPLLAARGLAKSYQSGPRRLDVLRGLDLDVAGGEALAVVGQSGVGKSTLMHLLGGLDRPDAGRITFRGEDIRGGGPAQRAAYRNRHVGLVFQFHHLLPELSALENVEMPFRIARRSGRAEAGALLEALGLGQRLHHRPGELSGGEQQRVAVARALAPSPELVLADEPTGNLDPRTGAEVFELLRELQRARGFALVLVTHNERLARDCDRVLHLVGGRLDALDEHGTRAYFEGLGANVAPDPML
jgi:lipoprotein-releasing system ATP-binding protein